MIKYICLAALLSCAHIKPTQQAIQTNEMCSQAIIDGDTRKARSLCLLALEYTPGFHDARLNLALVDLAEGRGIEARDSVFLVLKENPENPRANNLACYIEAAYLKDFAMAEAFCRKAVSINPAFIDARFKLGQILMKQEKYLEALEQFSVISKINPKIADAYCKIGEALVMLDRIDDAEKEFTQAIAVDAEYEEAYVMLGLIKHAKGQFCEAETILTECTNKIPASQACYKNKLEAADKCGL